LLTVINRVKIYSLARDFVLDYRYFSDICFSQGSVVTCCGVWGVARLVINTLLQIYCWVRRWKNFDNRSTFGEVTGNSRVSCFFDSRST